MFEVKTKKEILELQFSFHGLLLDIVDSGFVDGLKPLLIEFFGEFNATSGPISKLKFK